MKKVLAGAAIVVAGLLAARYLTVSTAPPPLPPPHDEAPRAPNPYLACETGSLLRPNALRVAARRPQGGPPYIEVAIAHPAGAERPDLTVVIHAPEEAVDRFAADPANLEGLTLAVQPADGRGRLTLSHDGAQLPADCTLLDGHTIPVCKVIRLNDGPDTLALRRALSEGRPIAYRYDKPPLSGLFILNRSDLAAAAPAARQALEDLRRMTAAEPCIASAIEAL